MPMDFKTAPTPENDLISKTQALYYSEAWNHQSQT